MLQTDFNTTLELREGERLGDFMLRRKIGSGAMADVWLAVERSLDRTVALKILRPGGDVGSVERFLREAKTAAMLDHPNIVRIYTVGEFEKTKRRKWAGKWFVRSDFVPLLHYIAEEYIPGLNLRQWLESRGRLSVEQTLSILGQVATALKIAARNNIVHRDIKPENILLCPTGLVKVVDFGLALGVRMPSDLTLTQVGMTLGTPLYMSPEQAESRELDVRSDIYSLGVTAYQMLTGKVPFTGSTPFAVLLAHRTATFEPIHIRRPDVPLELEQMIGRMLAKEPGERFADADVLLTTIRAVSAALDGSAPDSVAVPDVSNLADASFPMFEPDSSEVAAFESRLDAIESSRLLQTRLTALGDVKNRKNRFALKRSPRQTILRFSVALFLCATLGAGVGLLGRLSPVNRPPTEIQRFNTVQEQWVFAAQVGTSGAWQSVIEYFPDQPYWTTRAERQMARALLLEGRSKEARRLFERILSAAPAEHAFAQAGIAWCLANDGLADQAAALVSELRSGSVKTYDRLTEDILSQTLQMIRARGNTPQEN